MAGFMEFLRKQGVIGLAVGFILGGAIAKVVASLVSDIVNPFIGLILGKADLAAITIKVGSVEVLLGHFISVLIDFIVIAAVIYFIMFKALGLDKMDIAEEE